MVLVVEKKKKKGKSAYLTWRGSFHTEAGPEHRGPGQVTLPWPRLAPNLPLIGQKFRTPRRETGSYEAALAILDNSWLAAAHTTSDTLL